MGTKTTVSIAMHVRCDRQDCGASRDLGAIVEHFTCRRCTKAIVLSSDRWRQLLDAAVHDLPRMSTGTELTFDVERASGYVVAKKTAPSCACCSAVLPDEAAGRGAENGSCFCPGCGAKLLVRPVPSSLAAAFPGITHLFGEDIGQIANPDNLHVKAADSGIASCPNCGAGVNADGTSRAVVCAHCRSMVVLPDDVWERFRPSVEKHVFYLVHDDSVPPAPFRADFCWKQLVTAVGDKDGTIYAIGADGESHGNTLVFALDSQLRTKWARRGLKPLDMYSRLAWRSDGALLVWNTQKSAAVLLRSADGAYAGTLGGKQPEGSTAHNLDLSTASSGAVDVDGTVIFVKQQRLVRCAPDGTGIPIWPAHSGFLGRTIVAKPTPFTGSEDQDAPDLENIGDYPTSVRNDQVSVGWDGCLYVSDSKHLARFERTGKKSYVVPLPECRSSIRFGGDAAGNAYVMVRGDGDADTASILRVSRDGKIQCIVDGTRAETPLSMASAIVVRGDGNITVLDGYQQIRIFGSDGRLAWRSKAAIDEDNEEDEDDDD